MSTVIYRYRTDAGFVLASDGLNRKERAGAAAVEMQAQTIFTFGANTFLAYAFTGRIALGPDDDTMSFEFVPQIRAFAESGKANSFSSLECYARRLGNSVLERMKVEHARNPLHLPPDNEKDRMSNGGMHIVSVYIDGYHRKKPQMVNLDFYCKGGELFVAVGPGESCVTVSELIRDAYFMRRDECFQSYYPTSAGERLHCNDTLSKTAYEAKCFIEACKSPEAAARDAKFAEGVGGKTQIATITRTEGFQWVKDLGPPG